jgi:hypothetical protein
MYMLYYASMLRCWHLVRILVRTNHPCLGMGCHTHLPKLQLIVNPYIHVLTQINLFSTQVCIVV